MLFSEFLNLRRSLLEKFHAWPHILLNFFVHFGHRGIRVRDSVRNELREILQGGIERRFRIKLLLPAFTQVKRINKVRSSLSLDISARNERPKVILAHVLTRRQLHHVKKGLLLADVREKTHEFGVRILALNNLRYHHFFRVDHFGDHCCESSLVLRALRRQHDIDTCDEVVAGDLTLLSEPKHFELPFAIVFAFHLNVFLFHHVLVSRWVLFLLLCSLAS